MLDLTELAFVGGVLMTIGVALVEWSYTINLAFQPIFTAIHVALTR